MQQLFILGPGKTEWRETEDLQIRSAQEAIVRPLAVSVCDADVGILQGQVPFPFPYPFGHEAAGEVVAVGEDVRTVWVGSRVIVPFQISCGTCVACRRGHTAACRTSEDADAYGQIFGHAAYGFGKPTGSYGGMLGDQVRVPFADAMLVLIPEGLAAETVSAASDNLTDAHQRVAPTLHAEPEADVLVVGGRGAASSIGLYAVALARALGASKVDYVSDQPSLLSIAERLGGRPIEAKEPPGRVGRYRLTVDTSAHPDWLATAIRSTDAFGTCATCGVYFGEVRVPLGEAYNQGLRLEIGWVNVRSKLPEVLAMVRNGVDLSPIHTVVPWSSAPEALSEPLPPKLVFRR